MNRIIKKIGFFVLIFLLIAGSLTCAHAEPEGLLANLDIEASGSLDYYSRYVWRGFTLDTDPVIQPSFSLSAKGFTFTFWSSWDVDNNDALASDEMDFVFDYTKDFENFSVSMGHTYYDFPGTNGYSKEFYVGVGTDKIPVLDLPISTSLKFYRDYGDQNHGGGLGNYLELGLGYSKTLIEDMGLTLDLGTTLGYNHRLFMAGDGGQATFKAGFTVPLTKSLTFSPNLNYTVPFGGLADQSGANQSEIFWGGFSLAYSF